MRSSFLFRAACFALLLCAASSASAGVITLTDGSRIVGTITRLYDGKLTIQTQFAGTLEIEAAQITSIGTEERVNIQLESGDRLVGTIEITTDGEKPIAHTAVGDIPFPVEALNAVWPEGEQSPEAIAHQAELEAAVAALKPHWSAKLEFGGNATEGNSDTLTFTGRFDLVRKTSDDLLRFYLAGNYGEQNNKRSRNEILGGIKYENMLSERWYWYARTEMEYDEFENLDLRTTIAAGGGYYWLKEPDHELKTGLGVGFRHESYNTGVSNDNAVLDLGLDYRIDIKTWAQFTHSLVYSPAFDEINDYRLKLDTALAIPLANSDVWKLKLGVKNEYNSQPQSGLERLDNMYYANLVFEVKD